MHLTTQIFGDIDCIRKVSAKVAKLDQEGLKKLCNYFQDEDTK